MKGDKLNDVFLLHFIHFFLFFHFLIVTPLPKDLGYDNLTWKILTKSKTLEHFWKSLLLFYFISSFFVDTQHNTFGKSFCFKQREQSSKAKCNIIYS